MDKSQGLSAAVVGKLRSNSHVQAGTAEIKVSIVEIAVVPGTCYIFYDTTDIASWRERAGEHFKSSAIQHAARDILVGCVQIVACRQDNRNNSLAHQMYSGDELWLFLLSYYTPDQYLFQALAQS